MFPYLLVALLGAPAWAQPVGLRANLPPKLTLIVRRRVEFKNGRAPVAAREGFDIDYCTLAQGDSPEARAVLEPGFKLKLNGYGFSHERELTMAFNRDARGRARYYLWCLVFTDRPVLELGPLEDALHPELFFRLSP